MCRSFVGVMQVSRQGFSPPMVVDHGDLVELTAASALLHVGIGAGGLPAASSPVGPGGGVGAAKSSGGGTDPGVGALQGSSGGGGSHGALDASGVAPLGAGGAGDVGSAGGGGGAGGDRKSTRLNSSHVAISYAVF